MHENLFLPEDFDELIEKREIQTLKSIFDTCNINAVYDGYFQSPALSAIGIPEELVRWMISKGADINKRDILLGRTPLHDHSRRKDDNIDVFLELNADIAAKDNYGNTPLHMAVISNNIDKINKLLDKGADPDVENKFGYTPLDSTVIFSKISDIPNLEKILKILLNKMSPEKRNIYIGNNNEKINDKLEIIKNRITVLGEDFEKAKENYVSDEVDSLYEALDSIYNFFRMQGVEKVIRHDGVSNIEIPDGKDTMEKYYKLWDYLVPFMGPAKTLQGEVIRIPGKIGDENFRNDKMNWGPQYKEMLKSLMNYFKSHNSLSKESLKEARELNKIISKKSESESKDINRLCELSVEWVAANPAPIPLETPLPYKI